MEAEEKEPAELGVVAAVVAVANGANGDDGAYRAEDHRRQVLEWVDA